jgi:serpin B
MPNDLIGPGISSLSWKGVPALVAFAVFPIFAALPACGGSGGSTPVGVEQSSQPRITNPTVSTDDASELSSDNQGFAVDLYQQLRGQAGADDNLVFSPVSISLALAMLYNGAETETATQMATALHFTLATDRLNAAFDALDLALTTPPAGGDAGMFQLSLANSTWIQQGFSILPAYLDVLAQSYGAGINSLDFETAPETARNTINAWVAGKTQNQIPALFPEGSIDDSTRLVLADAVYFHGDWVAPFDANSPNATFHAQAGDVSVPMMTNKEASAELWSGTGWQAASLAYQGDAASMILVVPDAGTFDTFEQTLTATELAAILMNTQQAFGALSMPRFTFSLSTSLNATLAALGMPDAFDESTADFSGIDGTKDLHVQTVVHQADIAVDEKGTTAAAATGVGIGTSSVVLNSLTVDRPFLFFIVHRTTGALLFAGRVVDPSKTN